MSLEKPEEAASPEPELTPEQQRIAKLEEENKALRQRNEALGAENGELKEENERLGKENKELEELALMDKLTGTFNRHGLERMAKTLLHPDKRNGQEKRGSIIEKRNPIALTIVDIDDFKQFNDEHGHAKGDEVLRETAKVLEALYREGDVIGRWGGEEFVIIHPDVLPEDISKRIFDEDTGRMRVGFTTEINGQTVAVRFSGGITAVRDNETFNDLEAIIHRADGALYESKNAGKDRITHADKENSAEEPASGEL